MVTLGDCLGIIFFDLSVFGEDLDLIFCGELAGLGDLLVFLGDPFKLGAGLGDFLVLVLSGVGDFLVLFWSGSGDFLTLLDSGVGDFLVLCD